jgi:histidyl-tRNA synthetase
MLSLRYDLTVPFARFIALHGKTNIKVALCTRHCILRF